MDVVILNRDISDSFAAAALAANAVALAKEGGLPANGIVLDEPLFVGRFPAPVIEAQMEPSATKFAPSRGLDDPSV